MEHGRRGSASVLPSAHSITRWWLLDGRTGGLFLGVVVVGHIFMIRGYAVLDEVVGALAIVVALGAEFRQASEIDRTPRFLPDAIWYLPWTYFLFSSTITAIVTDEPLLLRFSLAFGVVLVTIFGPRWRWLTVRQFGSALFFGTIVVSLITMMLLFLREPAWSGQGVWKTGSSYLFLVPSLATAFLLIERRHRLALTSFVLLCYLGDIHDSRLATLSSLLLVGPSAFLSAPCVAGVVTRRARLFVGFCSILAFVGFQISSSEGESLVRSTSALALASDSENRDSDRRFHVAVAREWLFLSDAVSLFFGEGIYQSRSNPDVWRAQVQVCASQSDRVEMVNHEFEELCRGLLIQSDPELDVNILRLPWAHSLLVEFGIIGLLALFFPFLRCLTPRKIFDSTTRGVLLNTYLKVVAILILIFVAALSFVGESILWWLAVFLTLNTCQEASNTRSSNWSG